MANEERIDSLIDIQACLTQINTLKAELNSLLPILSQIAKGVSGSGSNTGMSSGIKETTEALSEQEKQTKKLVDIQNKIIATQQGVYDEEIKYKEALKQATAEQKKKVLAEQDAEKQYASVRQELKAVRNELTTLIAAGKGIDNPEVKKLATRMDELKDSMTKAKNMAELMDKAGKFEAFAKGVTALSAAFEVARGVTAAFGSENKDLQKVMTRVQGVIAMTHGLQTLVNNLRKESIVWTGLEMLKVNALAVAQKAYNLVVGESVGAMKIFKLALAGTGIGLLVLGVSELIKYFKSLNEQASVYQELVKETYVDMAKEANTMINIGVELNSQNISREKRNTLIDDYNVKAKESNLQLLDENNTLAENNQIMKENLAVIQARLILKAAETKQEANLAKYLELNNKQMAILGEIDKASSNEKTLLNEQLFETQQAISKIITENTKYQLIIDQSNKIVKDGTIITKDDAVTKDKATETEKKLNTVKKDSVTTAKSYLEKTKEETDAYKKLTTEIEHYKELRRTAIIDGNIELASNIDTLLKSLQAQKEAIDLITESFGKNTEIGGINTKERLTYTDRLLQKIEEEKEKITELEEVYEEYMSIGKEFGNEVGSAVAEAMKNGDDIMKAAGKATLQFWLKELKNYAEIQIAKSFMSSIGTMGIAGAVQAAILTGLIEGAYNIVASKISQYEKGRDGGSAEIAIVGEKGFEGILHDNKLTLTPDKPSITYLPEGASVIPHEKMINILSQSPNVGFAESVNNQMLLAEIISKDNNRLIRAIQNKKESHINITEKGIQKLVKNGSSWTKYLDDYIRL